MTKPPLSILYLATADARGHLMRCQLLTHALRQAGVRVEVVTTSVAGQQFLRQFAIEARLLSEHYRVCFDDQQNMLAKQTDQRILAYLLLPSRMLRDLLLLSRWRRGHDVLINDSLHPALITAGALLAWPVVQLYGVSLRRALEHNFSGRAPGWLVRWFACLTGWALDRSWARIEHDFIAPVLCQPFDYQLPTPIALTSSAATLFRNQQGFDGKGLLAAVYLNPHFVNIELAQALMQALTAQGYQVYAVGEGVAQLPGWLAYSTCWADAVANADVLVSAAGMASLSLALVHQKPVLLLDSAQPEQRTNLQQLRQLNWPCAAVQWQNDASQFSAAVAHELQQLQQIPMTCTAISLNAPERLAVWLKAIQALAALRLV